MNGEVPVFDQLLNILGKDDMRRFLSAFGGRDFKFPKFAHSPTGEKIASIVGAEKAASLIDAFCGGRFYVPKHPAVNDPDSRYLRLMADGLTNTEISLRLGVTERSVRRAMARCAPGPRSCWKRWPRSAPPPGGRPRQWTCGHAPGGDRRISIAA